MSIVRARATALLDAIDHAAVASHVAVAAAFVACFRSGDRLDAWALVQRLAIAAGPTADAPGAAASLAKISCFPVKALAWAWADQGTEAGQLDLRPTTSGQRRNGHPWDDPSCSGMGAVLGWWIPPRVPRGILVLSGQTGAGKTVPSVFAGVQYGGRFIRAAEIGEMALGSADAMKELEQIPFLVIDELGRESSIGPTTERVIELLGNRDENGLTTLANTQVPLIDLKDEPGFGRRYGHHLVDRIEKAGRWFNIAQPSRRSSVQPRLTAVRRSCRIADLLPKVEILTGPTDRPEEKALGILRELQELLGISDDTLAKAAADREAWMTKIRAQADAVGGLAGSVVRDRLDGVTAENRRGQREVACG